MVIFDIATIVLVAVVLAVCVATYLKLKKAASTLAMAILDLYDQLDNGTGATPKPPRLRRLAEAPPGLSVGPEWEKGLLEAPEGELPPTVNMSDEDIALMMLAEENGQDDPLIREMEIRNAKRRARPGR